MSLSVCGFKDLDGLRQHEKEQLHLGGALRGGFYALAELFGFMPTFSCEPAALLTSRVELEAGGPRASAPGRLAVWVPLQRSGSRWGPAQLRGALPALGPGPAFQAGWPLLLPVTCPRPTLAENRGASHLLSSPGQAAFAAM